MQSDKGIVWVGVAMFLFGLASIIYPPLKLLIGSMTTSVAWYFGIGSSWLIVQGALQALAGWLAGSAGVGALGGGNCPPPRRPSRPRELPVPRADWASADSAVDAAVAQGVEWTTNYG